MKAHDDNSGQRSDSRGPADEDHEHAHAERESGCESCGHEGHEHGGNRAESISLVISGALVGVALILHWTGTLSPIVYESPRAR